MATMKAVGRRIDGVVDVWGVADDCSTQNFSRLDYYRIKTKSRKLAQGLSNEYRRMQMQNSARLMSAVAVQSERIA